MAAQINTAFDRCDRDEAERAMVWLYRETDDLTLSLCGHHFRQDSLELSALGFDVVEDRMDELEPKVLVSADAE